MTTIQLQVKILFKITKLVFPDPRFRPLFLRYDQKINTGSATTWKLRSQLDIGSGWPARSRLECVTSCTTWLTCSGTWFAENEGMCYDIYWRVESWTGTFPHHICISSGNMSLWSSSLPSRIMLWIWTFWSKTNMGKTSLTLNSIRGPFRPENHFAYTQHWHLAEATLKILCILQSRLSEWCKPIKISKRKSHVMLYRS